ncbi:MAG: GDP-mannose 4,6-dehydratase [Chloroflexota bacterium]
MRVLITGINGFVGGHLAEHLLASDRWEVWGLARQPALALSQLAGRVRYICADMLSFEQVVSALESARPEVIFHLAGQSNVPRSFADPVGTLTANLSAQAHLFQAILKLRQEPLVLIAGSNEIYGAVRPEDLPIDEDTALRPVNPYAVSKAAQDLLALQYFISHRLRTVRLRPFNHIGPRQSDAFVASAFAAQVARIEAGLQPPLMRVGNLAAERDFTDVRDMARAYELAALHAEPGEAYNIGSGRAVRVQRLLDILMALSVKDIAVEADPARMRPADVPVVVCDSRRFRERSGWEPQIPLEQTLYDTLEYWRERVREHV